MNVGSLSLSPSEIKKKGGRLSLNVQTLNIYCADTQNFQRMKDTYFLIKCFIFVDSSLDSTCVDVGVFIFSFYFKMQFTTNDYFIQNAFLNYV